VQDLRVTLVVRAETPADFAAVDDVVQRCFALVGTAVAEEVLLVRGIRALPEFDPELSLVADLDGRIIGHLLFSPMAIVSAEGRAPALALAPLAVLPGFEGTHAGTRLMRRGLEVCRERGHRVVIVLGHPKYYRRFGFRPARAMGVEPPEPWTDEAFMARDLVPGALRGIRGVARYAAPFGLPGA
jgi:putative acetyltransferase